MNEADCRTAIIVGDSEEGSGEDTLYFDLTNGHMIAFAGLWDAWKDPANDQWLQAKRQD
jgi:hypothetical protein